MGRDYWIGLKISDNETNIAEKIVLEYVHFPRTLPQVNRLLGTGKGRITSPLHRLSLASTLTNFSPTHSKRVPTLVAQPVTITLPLVSKI